MRPVYWLGNWQFACLDYYHPPKGLLNRCVRAEPFPSFMQTIIHRVEDKVRMEMSPRDIPKGWNLNTCLINYYGDRIDLGTREDLARVGEHKDFEPGPVASLSFGDRALFQFVESSHREGPSRVVLQQWLEDKSLQIFAGEKFKKRLFHRVQRVERKLSQRLPCSLPQFEIRRINLTFRYVPEEHWVDLQNLPKPQQNDVQTYVNQLAQRSNYWSQVQNKTAPKSS